MRSRRGAENAEGLGIHRPLTLCVLCASAALSLLSVEARADTPPGTWDAAKDPAVRERWDLHVKVERLTHAPIPDAVEGMARRRFLEMNLDKARLLLEGAHVADGTDTRLRIDLGVIDEELGDLTKRIDLFQRAVDVLAPTVERDPSHPAAVRALASLVSAYAHLDQPRKELAAWAIYLPRIEDDRERITPMMNMGEAQMRVGQLEDALWTFREVLRLCGTVPNSTGINQTYALTLWDIALALDRSGDFGGALDTALRATAHKWLRTTGPAMIETQTGWDIIRDDSQVFFAPAWERDWYLALGYAAEGRAAKDPRDGVQRWELAVQHFQKYVDESSRNKPDDRWLTLARSRLEHVRAEHEAVAKRAARLPPRPQSDDRPWKL